MDKVVASIYELVAPRSLNIRKETLEIESEDQLLAKTYYTSISPGTELSAWLGKPALRPSKIYPRLQGYCNLAKVVNTGSEVANVRKGDWILTHQSHRSHFLISETDVLVTFKNLTDEIAKKVVHTYLYHLGYSALLNGGYFPGHKVGVVGCGALGYTTSCLLDTFGGSPIVLTSQPNRRSLFMSSSISTLSKSTAKTCGEYHKFFDLVINTSDSWDDYLLSLEILRPGGVCVLLGFPGRGEKQPAFNPMDSSLLYDKQLTIRYAGYVTEDDLSPLDVRFTLKRNMEYLSNLIAVGRVETNALDKYYEDWRNLKNLYENLHTRSITSLGGVLTWY